MANEVQVQGPVKTVVLTEDQLKQIISDAVRLYIKEQEKAEKRIEKKFDKGIKVKQMLASYRREKAALANEPSLTEDEKQDLRWKFMEDLMGSPNSSVNRIEQDIINKSKRRREKLFGLRCLENAVRLYGEECDKSSNEEHKRRYREVFAMYMDEEPHTAQEIAEIENVSEKTVYKDISLACKIIAIYLLA